MKLNMVVAAASIMILSQMAFAHEECERHDGPGGPGGPEFHHPHFDPLFFQAVMVDGKGPKEGPCADIKLDKAQKAAIKDAFFKFKEEKIDLEAAMHKAHLNAEKVRFDEKATLEQAQAASKAKLEAMTKMLAAEDDFRNNLEFKLLKTEQRGPARACEWMSHEKFGERGPAGGHFRKHKKDENDSKK